ncbi:MAG: large subunit ribosomal protein [Miltoncostaeaceae bacterium]|jgi:large subunit ribosomal protein L24|nr:large subunit ribosomal protein [Miltoncostaeaceae bacterium]
MPARIRKGDEVQVISGKDKGKRGKVLEVRPKDERVVVEGLNMIKRHTKPRPPKVQGGVIERPAPIHWSNVALLDPADKQPTRVRFQVVDGKSVRVAARSGQKIG